MEQENSSARALSIEFTGSGREYFGIWIVNILLTILTLGIYTAWAKVRTRKYFYNNTRVDGAIFDYHANPIAILKGWAIVVVVLIIYQVVFSYNPVYGISMMAVIMAFIPWAMVRSRVFNMLNTSYRNVRFYFEREYKELYTIFLIAPIPIIIGYGLIMYQSIITAESGEVVNMDVMGLGGMLVSVGFLLLPYFTHRFYCFIISNSSFGRTRFETSSEVGSFYVIYIKGTLLGLLVAVILGLLFWGGISLKDTDNDLLAAILIGAAILVYVFGLYYVMYYIEASKLNEIWGKTSIDDNKFVSKLTAWGFTWLILSNTFLIVLTLGIFIPWATVRMTRYRLNNLVLEVNGDMDNFIAKGREEMGALGAELGDAMDFEISL